MQRVRTRLSIMMFLQFFIWGAWYVTVGNFIGAIDWSVPDGTTLEDLRAATVGDAYSVGPIAAIISPLFLGMVADRFFATQKVLGVMHLIGGGIMFAMPVATSGDAPSAGFFSALLLVYMLFYMPTLGLVNTLAFHNIRDQEKEFPIIRVFGTLGWIAAGTLVSKVLKADTATTQFWVTGTASVLLAIYSFTLPHTPPPMAGQKSSVADVLGLRSLVLMKDRSFAVFVLASFLVCIPLSAYYAFAPIYANEAGFADPGFVMSFGQWAEVLFMLVMPWFFVRLGVKWMLAVGMFAWVVRYGLFSLAADGQVLWLIFCGILLHGICYDFFFVTGQIYVDQKAPKSIRGQAQGFLVLMTLGLGLFIGAQVSDELVQDRTPADAAVHLAQIEQIDARISARRAEIEDGGDAAVEARLAELFTERAAAGRRARGWSTIWLYPALGAGVILLLFLAVFRAPRRRRDPEDGAGDNAGAAHVAGT